MPSRVSTSSKPLRGKELAYQIRREKRGALSATVDHVHHFQFDIFVGVTAVLVGVSTVFNGSCVEVMFFCRNWHSFYARLRAFAKTISLIDLFKSSQKSLFAPQYTKLLHHLSSLFIPHQSAPSPLLFSLESSRRRSRNFPL